MSFAITMLHLEEPAASVTARRLDGEVAWQVRCEACGQRSRWRLLLSLALGEFTRHLDRRRCCCRPEVRSDGS